MCHHHYHTPITCNRTSPASQTKCTATLYPEPTLIKCAFAELMPASSLQSQCWELDPPPASKNSPLTEATDEAKERARDRCRACNTGSSARTSEEGGGAGSPVKRPGVGGKRKDSIKGKVQGFLHSAEEKLKKGTLSRSVSSGSGSAEWEKKGVDSAGGNLKKDKEKEKEANGEPEVEEEEGLKSFMDKNVGRW
ncbi:hypothetical protein QBC44DRAFT_128918 [Cladorrhinum sp. PSN332]|nr:hypothetical protein QBC44DRAFT_128918 [Cladorrhinum sp. PSN332]